MIKEIRLTDQSRASSMAMFLTTSKISYNFIYTGSLDYWFQIEQVLTEEQIATFAVIAGPDSRVTHWRETLIDSNKVEDKPSTG